MDIEATIDATIEAISPYIPNNLHLSGILDNASSYFPTDLNFTDVAKFLFIFAIGALVLSVLGRVVLGKRSSLNHSLSSVMAILFVYAITIIVYTFKPWDLDSILSPLPFVTFFNDYLVVLPLVGIRLSVLSQELLFLVILAFLVNLLDTLLPQGKSIAGWFLLRFLMVILSLMLHILAHWAFKTYLPDMVVTYAPGILLSILVLLLTLGFLNAVLSLILTISNPVVGAIYGFFFSNIVGKQLTKAVFTTAILCVVIFLIGEFGYSFINISMMSLTAYVPLALICLLLWFLIGHLL